MKCSSLIVLVDEIANCKSSWFCCGFFFQNQRILKKEEKFGQCILT